MKTDRKVHIDQLNRKVEVGYFPQRIISLVPSQTELLFDLGLEDRIVGLTKFCIHPADGVKEKPIIGGPKNFRFDKIDELEPDLIIGNKEENYQEGIEALALKYPVWLSDVNDLESAYEMIGAIGSLTNQNDQAIKIIEGIRQVFNSAVEYQELTVIYLIWNKPYMVAGIDTFINSILKELYLKNLVIAERYPKVDANQLSNFNPDLIFLSSEPYPFKQKHVIELEGICPNSKVLLVDGEMFSWYGSRLLKTGAYFNRLLTEIES